MMKSRKKQVFNEINITPLTDIFLVLLIIMMVVAPMLDYPGLKLAVPTVGPDELTKQQPKTIALKISSDDKYALDDQAVSLPFLATKLRSLKKDKPDGLIIAADPKSSHNALTMAMDAAQNAGVTKIAVTGAEAPAEETAPEEEAQ